jgi:hypothetical protein
MGRRFRMLVNYCMVTILLLTVSASSSAAQLIAHYSHSIYLPMIFNQTIRTEVITFYPTGLSSVINTGYCWVNSTTLLRRDAWRCMDLNSQIYDPCVRPIGDTDYVVCGAHPITNPIGFRFYLTEPLPEPAPPSPNEEVHAWAMKLSNNLTCSLVQASTWPTCLPLYGCSDGLSIIDYPNPGILWKVERGQFSTDTCSLSQTVTSEIMTVWK